MIIDDNVNNGEVPAENPPKIPGARKVQHNKSGKAVLFFNRDYALGLRDERLKYKKSAA